MLWTLAAGPAGLSTFLGEIAIIAGGIAIILTLLVAFIWVAVLLGW